MAYGKYAPKEVIGLEIQEDMVEMAKRSVELNSLQGKVEFVRGDLKDTENLKKLDRFDVVTVNPPYKLNNSGILNPLDKLAIARHEFYATEDVIVAARRLLRIMEECL